MNYIKNHFLLLLGLMFLQGLYSYFNLTSLAYPRSDEAEYYLLSYRHLDFFRDSFFEGVKAFYNIRLWKPSLHGNLSLPFVALLPQNVLLANAIMLSVLTSIILFFVFKISEQFISRLDSLLVMLTLGLAPWFVETSHLFRAQLSYLAFFSGFIYFALLSLKSQMKSHFLISSLFLALAFCTRPIEAILSALPLALIYFYKTIGSNPQRKSNFLYVLVSVICFGLGVVFDVLNRRELLWPKLMIFLLWLACSSFYLFKHSSLPARMFFIFLSLVWGWFLDFFFQIYIWAYGGALHQHMSNIWQRPAGDYIIFWVKTFAFLHWPTIIFPCVALGIFHYRNLLKHENKVFFLFLVVSLIPLTVGAASENGSYWFYFNGSFLTIVFLSIFSLTPTKFINISRSIICAGLIFNFIPAYSKLSFEQIKLLPNHHERYLRPDPCLELVQKVGAIVDSDSHKEIGILLYQGEPSEAFSLYDRWCLNLVAREKMRNFHFESYWNGLPNEDYNHTMNLFKKRSDYLLIGPIGEFAGSNQLLEQNKIIRTLEQGFQEQTEIFSFKIDKLIKVSSLRGQSTLVLLKKIKGEEQ